VSERRSVAEHYEGVVDAWRLVMGPRFHVGYFDTPEEDLDRATLRLVARLASWGGVPEAPLLLDVGCGLGSVALLLHRSHRARVWGITLTRREALAARRAGVAEGCADAVAFCRGDARALGFGDGCFDVVWLMESSHLIRDKSVLVAEGYRVLRKGGRLLLCDFILQRPPLLADIFHYSEVLRTVERAFGRVKAETAAFFRKELARTGFEEVAVEDVTSRVIPTFDRWRDNLRSASDRLPTDFDGARRREFEQACRAVARLFREGFLGYGFVRGRKGEE
jgi:27-O-demethylrifamycin SV methyltransferase